MPENKDDIDLDGWNFYRAVWENQFDIARELIQQGEDGNAKSKDGQTPLFVAAFMNSRDMACLLLELGAFVEMWDQNGSTALHWAARHDSLDVARLLLEFGAGVHVSDENGYTPLHWAVQAKSSDVVNLLCDPRQGGADFFWKAKSGSAPHHLKDTNHDSGRILNEWTGKWAEAERK